MIRDDYRIDAFRSHLFAWGKDNIQTYPWRYSSDPYRVLVSEFMLHRTQSKQVLPIYNNFIHVFPSLESFSQANHDVIIDVTGSLGLNWRLQGMEIALKEIWHKYQQVPLVYKDLIAIKGIGQYIAGATLCFSLNIPMTLVDSNIVRVVGRVFGLDLSGEARRKKEMVESIGDTVDKEKPRDFYYSIIDLSHVLCRPRHPDCINCPLASLPCKYQVEQFQSYR